MDDSVLGLSDILCAWKWCEKDRMFVAGHEDVSSVVPLDKELLFIVYSFVGWGAIIPSADIGK